MDATIAVRIDKKRLDELKAISSEESRKKSETLREVLDLGIREKKLSIALQKYKRGEVSTGKAAYIAGISLSRFLDVLRERGIPFNYSVRDLMKDFEEFL